MARMDPRCNLRIPVTLVLDPHGGKIIHQAVISNLGLRGAFIDSALNLPASSPLKVLTDLPGMRHEIDARVLRCDERGLALGFHRLYPQAKDDLWTCIRENLREESLCPFCGERGVRGNTCERCGFSLDFTTRAYLRGHEQLRLKRWMQVLDSATGSLNSDLALLDREYAEGLDEKAGVDKLREILHRFFGTARQVDDLATSDPELLQRTRARFREETGASFEQSYFVRHARSWPLGYPGDYRMLENIYRNEPLSEGLGYLQDRYFLETELAVGVRERLGALRDMLAAETARRERPRILDIACGSCRELLEIAPELKRCGARVTCLDLDVRALQFSLQRLALAGLDDQTRMERYNALRMVSHERNLKEFGPQDIIYSVGLFDYLADDIVERLCGALYRLLRPGGKLILAFKDRYRYETCDYQWLVDWAHFFQRTEKNCRSIIEAAGIPPAEVTLHREGSGVIMFFTVERP